VANLGRDELNLAAAGVPVPNGATLLLGTDPGDADPPPDRLRGWEARVYRTTG
jgi:hypothetical protein